MFIVLLGQFCICTQKLGKDQLLKSEIRNLRRVLGRKSKNKKYVTVLVEPENFFTKLRFLINYADIYRGESRTSVTSK